jgi:hypothetical protein
VATEFPDFALQRNPNWNQIETQNREIDIEKAV